jgi:hypothetical protein
LISLEFVNGHKDGSNILIISNSAIFLPLIIPDKHKKKIIIVYGLTFLYRCLVGNNIGDNPIVLEFECVEKVFYVSSQG